MTNEGNEVDYDTLREAALLDVNDFWDNRPIWARAGILFILSMSAFYLAINTTVPLAGLIISTIVSVALVIVYTDMVKAQQEQSEKIEAQTTLLGESNWIPEVRQPLQNNWFVFSDNRPWYPWFKIEFEGAPERWHDEVVRRFPSEEMKESREPRNLHETLAWSVTDKDVDWYVPFPGRIRDYLVGLGNGTHKGKLIFRFETITGEDYFFAYNIHVRIFEKDHKIVETTHVERYLPWKKSKERDRLRVELENQLEEMREIEE